MLSWDRIDLICIYSSVGLERSPPKGKVVRSNRTRYTKNGSLEPWKEGDFDDFEVKRDKKGFDGICCVCVLAVETDDTIGVAWMLGWSISIDGVFDCYIFIKNIKTPMEVENGVKERNESWSIGKTWS